MKATIGYGTLYFPVAQTVQHGANNSKVMGLIPRGLHELNLKFFNLTG